MTFFDACANIFEFRLRNHTACNPTAVVTERFALNMSFAWRACLIVGSLILSAFVFAIVIFMHNTASDRAYGWSAFIIIYAIVIIVNVSELRREHADERDSARRTELGHEARDIELTMRNKPDVLV